MKSTLILVRHGETAKNVAKKLHTSKDLEKLNKTGISQMEKTGKKLKSLNVTSLYSSHEKRAQDSSKIISKMCGVKLNLIKGLEERNWGNFSGKEWSEIEPILKGMTLTERFNYIPPNGESWKSFEKRLTSAVNKIVKENEGKIVAVVTHGGVIRVLIPPLLGLPREESFKYDPDNASLTIYEYLKGKYTQKIYNDISHLN